MSTTNAHCKGDTPADHLPINPAAANTNNDTGSDEPGNPGHLPPETDPFCADNYPSPTDRPEIDDIE